MDSSLRRDDNHLESVRQLYHSDKGENGNRFVGMSFQHRLKCMSFLQKQEPTKTNYTALNHETKALSERIDLHTAQHNKQLLSCVDPGLRRDDSCQELCATLITQISIRSREITYKTIFLILSICSSVIIIFQNKNHI